MQGKVACYFLSAFILLCVLETIWISREKWPDDVFGCDGASNEDDVQHIHDIFFNSSSGMLCSCMYM